MEILDRNDNKVGSLIFLFSYVTRLAIFLTIFFHKLKGFPVDTGKTTETHHTCNSPVFSRERLGDSPFGLQPVTSSDRKPEYSALYFHVIGLLKYC